MIWFLHDPARYRTEVDAITELEAGSDWLTVVKWGLDGARLCCEADLAIGEQVYPITLRYNRGFPYVPPSVVPRVEARWSMHQYGPGGELCLEHGPDNWTRELGGADMLISAYRLLRDEAPMADLADPVPVPSRHQTTLGQDLRARASRFVITPALQQAIRELDEVTAARFAVRIRNGVLVAYSVSVGTGGEEQLDPDVPSEKMDGTFLMPGWIVRKPTTFEATPGSSTTELRQAILGAAGEGSELPEDEFVLIVTDTGLRPFYLWHAGNKVFELTAFLDPDDHARLEPSYAVLKSKRVGLVGCGSLGSKVAAALARIGIGHLVLVDDDILRPENLVRNELDWTAVGEHKAAALARRLRLINPAITVDVWRLRLGGQESAAGLDAALAALGSCDLVVEATADDAAFNLLAAVATTEARPMVWAEVFAGGFGGAVVRSRPGLDPSPLEARRRMLQWYQQQGVAVPTVTAGPYGAIVDEIPSIADDADVAVIAAHLSRLAVDTALARSPSRFPYSAYVIGLHAQWLFTQPFDTAPINLGEPEHEEAPGPDDPKWQEGVEGLIKLMEQAGAATTDHD